MEREQASFPDEAAPRRRWPGIALLAVIAFVVGFAVRSPKTVITPSGGGRQPIAAGVPVAYAHDRQGALAAASNYTEALSGPLVMSQQTREAMIRQIVDPDHQAARMQDAERIAAGLPAAFGTGVQNWTTAVAGHIQDYNPDRAVVQVWRVVVVAGPAQTDPQESWGIETVELRWIDNDWRFVQSTTTDGPTPVQDPTSTATPSKDLLRTLEGWARFSHAPLGG